MPSLSEVVKHLIILNVLLFLLVNSPVGASFKEILALYFPADTRFAPYQLVSHMFMHANTGHIFFNMFGLYIFGPYVERYINSKNFFILYFLSGLGALIAHLGVQFIQFNYMGVQGFPPVVGASGALMGVVLAFAVLFPNMKLMLLFPPIPVKAKWLALAYVCFDIYSGVTGAQANVANFAHLGGAATGFLLTYFWFKRGNYRR